MSRLDIARLIEQESVSDVSPFVRLLATNNGLISDSPDLEFQTKVASDLSFDVPDYHEAALAAGWTKLGPLDPSSSCVDYWSMPGATSEPVTLFDDAAHRRLTPIMREVTSYISVSAALSQRLIQKHQHVGFLGETHVWARTGTGALADDPILSAIAQDLGITAIPDPAIAADRLAAHADPLVRAFADATGLDIDAEDPETTAGDLIAAASRWASLRGGDPVVGLRAAGMGLSQYMTYEFDRDKNEPSLGFSIAIETSAPEAGITANYDTGSETVIWYDEDAHSRYRNGLPALDVTGIPLPRP